MVNILLVSGGSGGHIVPLVAVARALHEQRPEAKLHFICSDEPEDAVLLRKEGFNPLIIPRPRRSIHMILQLWEGYRIAQSILKTLKPDVVFSKGGAVSLPVCYAAHKMNIPIVLHESDAVMGRANRIIARWAKKVCMGVGDVRHKHMKYVETGNPIRTEITRGSKERGLAITGLSGTKQILLVMGGSQGAEVLNEYVRTHINELLSICDIIHLTGKGKAGAAPHVGYWTTEFAHLDLAHLYACSNLAMMRAGAGSISECAAIQLPMMVVPIEGLANNHQVKNAEILHRNGGGVMIRQKNMNAQILPTLIAIMSDAGKYKTMQQSLVTFQLTEASRRIAEIILLCIA